MDRPVDERAGALCPVISPDINGSYLDVDVAELLGLLLSQAVM